MDEAEYATRLGFIHQGRLLDVGTRADIVRRYPRPLFEVRSADRLAVRARLAAMPELDDVSLFGTLLHARGRAGTDASLLAGVRTALADLVPAEAVTAIQPSLEDVFVLAGEADVEEAA
jgi:hypothetical protein